MMYILIWLWNIVIFIAFLVFLLAYAVTFAAVFVFTFQKFPWSRFSRSHRHVLGRGWVTEGFTSMREMLKYWYEVSGAVKDDFKLKE